jgi:hypothetical protein
LCAEFFALSIGTKLKIFEKKISSQKPEIRFFAQKGAKKKRKQLFLEKQKYEFFLEFFALSNKPPLVQIGVDHFLFSCTLDFENK